MLASDLDGTLIAPDSPAGSSATRVLSAAVESGRLLVAYVTGRHLALALEGIAEASLPPPGWLVCDVGTTVFTAGDNGFLADPGYRRMMLDELGGASIADLSRAVSGLAELTPQPPARQAEFKRSYFFDSADAGRIEAAVRERLGSPERRLRVVASRDPVTGRGLLDLLPANSGKRRALEYLTALGGFATDRVVFAGDSGNDLDALLSGHPAIVVGNASLEFKTEVRRQAEARGVPVYFAGAPFAAGVVEGCRHFGLI